MIWKEIKNSFKKGKILDRLIYINLAVFFCIHILIIVLVLTGITENFRSSFILIKDWLGLKANIFHILYKPFTLITFMFIHERFLHIFLNILVLYFSGKLFQDYLGQRRLLATYFIGGLFGAGVYIVLYNISPTLQPNINQSAIGASASTMAILIAIATYVPKLKIQIPLIGSISLIWIAFFFILTDIINLDDQNIGGHIGHLGGALWGFLYIYQYKKGNDMATWFYKLIGLVTSILKSSKLELIYKKTFDDYKYNEQKRHNQKIIDLILDKVSKSGYDSLSKKEKEILFKQGKKE